MARIYFAIIASVLLVLSAYAAYRDYAPEWKQYQREYYRLLADFEEDPVRSEQIAAASLGIQQVYNARYGIVDRCTTCHISFADPQFKDQEQPLKTHPAKILRKHVVEEVGCAVCHDGNGYGTSREAAHGMEEHSARPLATGKWKESLCVRCHPDGRRIGAAAIGRGLELIDRAACFACHNVDQLAARERIAPNLDGIGNKVEPEWLRQWLMAPRSYLEDTLMPDYGLDEEQALAVTAYLMTLTEPELAATQPTPAEVTELGAGRRLFEAAGCGDCHSIASSVGFEGIVAPDLTRIGDKVNPEWLAAWVKDPGHFQPGVAMPGFGFTDLEAAQLAAYLVTTFATTGMVGRASGATEDSENGFPRSGLQDEELVEKGAVLVDELGCLACHALGGEKLLVKIGPDLSDVGDWDPHHLEWGEVEEPEGAGLREFLKIKVASPRAFSHDSKMPTFGFSGEDVEAVVVALMSFSANPLPMEARIVATSEELGLPMPAGSVGRVFARYQCLTCHSLRGRFGQMAPDLAFEGDKVKKDWLIEYLRTPHLIRPLVEERMPNFGMLDEEIALIAGFIEMAWKDDRVPPDPFGGEEPAAELGARGQVLYESEYSCADCHREGEDLGPVLQRVGERLKPGWIYQFVLDPHLFYDNDMQNESVTEEDARALTAYLMSRRE